MLTCYSAASSATEYLRCRAGERSPTGLDRVWTSHEALVLDYEAPQVRRGPDYRPVLASTHWPWIGDRTR